MARTDNFKVSAPLLTPLYRAQCYAWLSSGVLTGRSIPVQWAHHGCVYCQLSAMPKGKAIRDDFYAVIVIHKDIQAEVTQKDVPCHSGTGLLANSS